MKKLLKNYLLKNKHTYLKNHCKYFLILVVVVCSLSARSQIANYVSNGGFEEIATPPGYLPKYWGATDTTKIFGELLSKVIAPIRVPMSSYAYQWPRHGNNHVITNEFCPTCQFVKRGYLRNRLKQPLKANSIYCFKMYVNLSNQSTHGIDAIGAYFSDNTIDTISLCNIPITYLTPQIQNPSNNIITDTLNWIPITGTFVANGTEKYMLIGNFKSDANTNKTFVNSANLPANFGDYLFDDISCIDVDLPAYAGIDKAIVLGDSAFIGRQPDVGIDDACKWYKLPSIITPTSPAIDTVAGLWVKPVVTTTYVVRQEICGNIKYDTVVIYMNAVGLEKLKILSEELKIYPIPAKDYFELRTPNAEWMKEFTMLSIYNNLGLLLKEEELKFKDSSVKIEVGDLPNGAYYIQLKSSSNEIISKRFIINR